MTTDKNEREPRELWISSGKLSASQLEKAIKELQLPQAFLNHLLSGKEIRLLNGSNDKELLAAYGRALKLGLHPRIRKKTSSTPAAIQSASEKEASRVGTRAGKKSVSARKSRLKFFASAVGIAVVYHIAAVFGPFGSQGNWRLPTVLDFVKSDPYAFCYAAGLDVAVETANHLRRVRSSSRYRQMLMYANLPAVSQGIGGQIFLETNYPHEYSQMIGAGDLVVRQQQNGLRTAMHDRELTSAKEINRCSDGYTLGWANGYPEVHHSLTQMFQ